MKKWICFLANQLDWTPKKTVNSDSECFKCSLHAVRGGVLHDNIKNGYVVFFWMILVKKFGIFLYFISGLKRTWNNVWWCYRQKAGLCRWQKYQPYIVKKLNFSQGVNPWFWSKILIFFFWCYFGLKGHNSILHGCAEIWNLSFSVEKYFMSERSEQVKYFFNIRRDILYLQAAM